MKTGTITINGKTYPLAFTVRAAAACEEKFGGLDNLAEALGGKNAVGNIAWMIATLADCGVRHEKANGKDTDIEAPTMDDLLDTLSVKELTDSVSDIMAAVTAGMKTTVQAEPPKDTGKRKNVKAAPRK